SGIVIGTATGAVGLAEGREGAASFWHIPEWSGRPVVWDFRAARLDVQPQEVRDLAQFILERQPATAPPRLALVAGRDLEFALLRMFEVFRDHPSTEVRVFRDIGEAVAWARIPGKPVP